MGSLHHLPRTPQAPVPADTPGAALLTLRGAIGHVDVQALCVCIEELLRDGDANLVVCDVAELTDPDCATVDALARMQLTAKRQGAELRLRGASDELHEVLAMAGLCEVVGLCASYESS